MLLPLTLLPETSKLRNHQDHGERNGSCRKHPSAGREGLSVRYRDGRKQTENYTDHRGECETCNGGLRQLAATSVRDAEVVKEVHEEEGHAGCDEEVKILCERKD